LQALMNDRRVERSAVPLVGAVRVDVQHLGRMAGQHVSPPDQVGGRPINPYTARTARRIPRNPKATLPAMFARASHKLPSRTSWKVPNSKVEKVETPPHRPVPMSRYAQR